MAFSPCQSKPQPNPALMGTTLEKAGTNNYGAITWLTVSVNSAQPEVCKPVQPCVAPAHGWPVASASKVQPKNPGSRLSWKSLSVCQHLPVMGIVGEYLASIPTVYLPESLEVKVVHAKQSFPSRCTHARYGKGKCDERSDFCSFGYCFWPPGS